MSTMGLTLLLPFAELCLRQVPRDLSVPLCFAEAPERGKRPVCSAWPAALGRAETPPTSSFPGLSEPP